jgi:two-component system CheB/CheR fusion protein
MLVFSKQNVLKDAPFSRIDLVSIRNLLIYLQPPAQSKVLRVLHYSLNPLGYLLLGSSETVGDAPELFASIDRRHRIYVKKQVAVPAGLETTFVPTLLEPERLVKERPVPNLQSLADRKILELYGPPGVIINEELEVLQFRGHTGPFLDPVPGAASFNLLRIARLEFHIELKRAVQQAVSEHQRVTTEVTFQEDGKPVVVRLDVVPIADPETKAHRLLVLFHELPPPREVPIISEAQEGGDTAGGPLRQRIHDLEHELTVTKEYLQAMTEEKESALEELKSANEELQSSNEELQSTNEELQTSKEEMQSANEELTTVNEELQNRMAELSQTNDDLHNVLTGIDNAVVIVGMDLKIRRYTAAAEKLFHLMPGDIGRAVGFLDAFLESSPLEPKVSSAIQNLSTLEEEVLASNHRWYTLKISPYKTLDYAIRGALVTLVDIDVRKRAEEMTRKVSAYAGEFLSAVGHPLLIVDLKQRVLWGNNEFFSTFQLTAEETLGSTLGTICTRQLDDPGLHERLERVFASATTFRDYQLQLRFPEGEQRMVRIGGSLIPASSETPSALVSIELFEEGPPGGKP